MAGDVAETSVEHVFLNETDQRLEAFFRFPLPDEALVVGLAMEIGGVLEEGRLMEREEARRTYQSIVDSMKDPALLEWDGGRHFELRVFPVEPQSQKRIVLRYLSPVVRQGAGWRYVLRLGRPDAPPFAFRFAFEGDVRLDEEEFRPDGDITVDVPSSMKPGPVSREITDDGTFLAARIEPAWDRVPARLVPAMRRVLVLVDVSRSMLESRQLARQALGAVVAGLDPRDQVLAAAVDLDVRPLSQGWEGTGKDVGERLDEALGGIEPDGASDIGGALAWAGDRLAELGPSERADALVIYIGDGHPTWGVTGSSELLANAGSALGPTGFSAVALGRAPETALLRSLARKGAGRVLEASTRGEVEQFVRFLRYGTPDLVDAEVTAPAGVSILPTGAATLHRGEEFVVLMRSTGEVPREVWLRGNTNNGPYEQRIDLTHAIDAPHVARRWAGREIERLQATKAPRADIVATSLQFGVLSKATAFLVLEPEVKRIADESESPGVSGKDLETLDSEASLSPDRLQPGDPEVRVLAPADARSVVVTFPWGESVPALYEADLRAWTVRFLVPAGTPEGPYDVWVHITHANGRAELLKLGYTVDEQAPVVRVKMAPREKDPQTMEITATVVVVDATTSRSGTTAQSREECRRVEVRVPDGRVIVLGLVRDGLFRGLWRPRQPVTGPLELTVVTVDRALNERLARVSLDPSTATVVEAH